jgi:cellulose synthase/poly-beta-1,6-N-acetylglucosamine synthase-like glycosyltransferase
MAYNIPSTIIIVSFIFFIGFAWLYGFYNIFVIVYALIYKRFVHKPEKVLTQVSLIHAPEVAILYTTYNDFVLESVMSCIQQDYPNFKVYILDDSTEKDYMDTIDLLAEQHPQLVTVVRRADRVGFKAGNMNHGLEHFAKEKYFAIADADEILPSDFLKKLVPVMESDEKCGFVQANHRANPESQSKLSEALGIGIDIHWKYYQPLRNEYGFVMFLGHGALLSRKCWEEIGGFPHIVSEDLGFAIHAREKGYRGRFVEDVICYEDFPDSVRSFRVRHMKWTRGTCEFLKEKSVFLLRSKNITWQEKLDILFPTLNLPLTLIYFLFMIVANLLLPLYFGVRQDLTFEVGSSILVMPIYALPSGFEGIYTIDFFLITMLTFFAPVLCFIVDMWKTPVKLIRFISHSTALYAALGPLSSIGVLTYMISGKAIFLVTGDKNQASSDTSAQGTLSKWKTGYQNFVNKSHPDTAIVQGFEILTGVVFAVACIFMFQISFLGLCLAFALMPLMHHIGWDRWGMKFLAHLPYLFIMFGIFLAGLSLVGMQTMFFGYGFHF